jgi:hypothetical protein
MNTKDVHSFEKTQAQIQALHEEIGALSKKSPGDALNKFKLKLVNELIGEANGLLKGDYRPLGDFESFSEEDIPTNSDVTLVLAQYLSCLEKFRADNIQRGEHNIGWYWTVGNHISDIQTAPPRKLHKE